MASCATSVIKAMLIDMLGRISDGFSSRVLKILEVGSSCPLLIWAGLSLCRVSVGVDWLGASGWVFCVTWLHSSLLRFVGKEFNVGLDDVCLVRISFACEYDKFDCSLITYTFVSCLYTEQPRYAALWLPWQFTHLFSFWQALYSWSRLPHLQQQGLLRHLSCLWPYLLHL